MSTADTRAALREGMRRGASSLAICNAVESSIARDSDHVIYTHAGPEIGVASTKAFTAQLAVLILVALHLGQLRNTIEPEQASALISDLIQAPNCIDQLLAQNSHYEAIAKDMYKYYNSLYLGRGIHYPIALEGALKLKEISYIHAEGYPAAETKHGPIALIDENMPVVVIALRDSVYDKVLSNIEEVRARKGSVIAIASEGDTEIADKVNQVIYIPYTRPLLTPILASIPLQLLAYHIAVLRGCHIDQPRNLAKSVTVK